MLWKITLQKISRARCAIVKLIEIKICKKSTTTAGNLWEVVLIGVCLVLLWFPVTAPQTNFSLNISA